MVETTNHFAIIILVSSKNSSQGKSKNRIKLLLTKLNSFLDQKTRWIDQLDHQNIAKNKAYGIEAPKDPVSSFGHVFSSVLTNKLQQAGPFISIVTSKLGGLSAGGSGSASGHGDGHSNGSGGFLGSIGALLGGASGASSGGNHEVGATASLSIGHEAS